MFTGSFHNSWHRAIFPGGHPPSIVAADRLYLRVRDGNGCVPVALAPRNFQVSGYISNQYPGNCTLRFVCISRQCLLDKPSGTLVTLSYVPPLCGTYTCVLSTSGLLEPLLTYVMGFLILRWASYLYAFSTYPLRTQLPSVYRWHDNWHTGGSFVLVLSY